MKSIVKSICKTCSNPLKTIAWSGVPNISKRRTIRVTIEFLIFLLIIEYDTIINTLDRMIFVTKGIKVLIPKILKLIIKKVVQSNDDVQKANTPSTIPIVLNSMKCLASDM